MSIDESRVEDVVSGGEQGAGLQVVSDGTAYFAHVDGLAEDDLMQAAEEVASALRGSRSEPQSLSTREGHPQKIEVRPEDVPAQRKSDMLRELDERGRAQGDEIAQLRVSYGEARREIVVANSAGTYATDDRTRVRVTALATAELRPEIFRLASRAGRECRGARRELAADLGRDRGAVQNLR